MFKKIEGGTVERICNRFDCWIPPVGWGVNSMTGELEQTDIITRSPKKAEQFWEHQPYPSWWKEKRKIEKKKQKLDPDFIDQDCERHREQEWNRRLRGVWVYMNGKPVYITGLHYFYLNWWKYENKFLDYRDPNRKFFYVWRYCEEDPNCLGLIEITKRKDGKTGRAGAILYEYVSRMMNKHAGIQSKTDDDAYEVFDKAVIQPWRLLPDFFRPIYDTSKGDHPGEELKFFHASQRGKDAAEEEKGDDLQSFVDYKPRGVAGYDGPILHRYVSDEAGKLKDVSIYARHSTVSLASEVDGVFIGKHLYTTTVEEMESGGGEFLKLVQASDFDKRNKNGRTTTGLYVYFLPAYETMSYDKYGMPDIKAGLDFFNANRDGFKAAGDDDALQSYIRKNPFTLEECFKTDSSKCLYNAFKLEEQEKFLRWNTDLTQFGNFYWEDGIKDSTVLWQPDPNGRWEVSWLPEENDRNRVKREGNIFSPLNTNRFVSGCDTYDHDSTEDNRNSKAASFVKRRAGGAEDKISRKFVVKYHARPPLAELAYEDLIMQCCFFGCQMLAESNKPGVLKYFNTRGYGAFLIYVKGYKEPGIPSTTDNKKAASLMIESYIQAHSHKIDFVMLISQLLKFDIKNTQKFDLVMAMFWTEYADDFRYFDPEEKKTEYVEIEDFMPQY